MVLWCASGAGATNDHAAAILAADAADDAADDASPAATRGPIFDCKLGTLRVPSPGYEYPTPANQAATGKASAHA